MATVVKSGLLGGPAPGKDAVCSLHARALAFRSLNLVEAGDSVDREFGDLNQSEQYRLAYPTGSLYEGG